MAVYNESDILEQAISYIIQQGISLIIIDGGSTDGSLEIERRFVGKGVLEVHILAREYYMLSEVLREGLSRAAEQSPDWIVHVDADEFLEPSMQNMTLAEALEEVDDQGYNLIQFNCFEFLLTEQDHQSSEPNVRKRLKFYTWTGDFYFLAWKHYVGIDLTTTGGHKPIFPREIKKRVFPTKFILRHYRFRSSEHGLRKVFKERLPRYAPEEHRIGWHIHYDNFKPDQSYFIINSAKLNRYDEDGKWVVKKVFDPFFGAWNPKPTRISLILTPFKLSVKKRLHHV
jgi:glycosyltransferase involved in cell wall biosynthesis